MDSRIFERKRRLEIGRKLIKLSKLMLVFLGNRVTVAFGTTSVHRESFIILKTTRHKEAKYDL